MVTGTPAARGTLDCETLPSAKTQRLSWRLGIAHGTFLPASWVLAQGPRNKSGCDARTYDFAALECAPFLWPCVGTPRVDVGNCTPVQPTYALHPASAWYCLRTTTYDSTTYVQEQGS